MSEAPMTDPDIQVVRRIPLPKIPTYIGRCCREWELAYGAHGKCGLCGEVPVYVDLVSEASKSHGRNSGRTSPENGAGGDSVRLAGCSEDGDQ